MNDERCRDRLVMMADISFCVDFITSRKVSNTLTSYDGIDSEIFHRNIPVSFAFYVRVHFSNINLEERSVARVDRNTTADRPMMAGAIYNLLYARNDKVS